MNKNHHRTEYKGRRFSNKGSLQRQMITKIMHDDYHCHISRIAKLLNVHRTTAIYYLEAINDALEVDPQLRREYDSFKQSFAGNNPLVFNKSILID